MLKIQTIIIFVFSLFASVSLYSQRINGLVVNELTNEKIPFVSILAKTQDDKIIGFSQTDDNGYFEIILDLKDNETITIETSIIGYLPSKKDLFLSEKHYEVNFSLTKSSTIIDEVYIEATRKAISVKQDTTAYDISQFMDGSERVVEDILKKLPGISVGENGSLKFKGKQVTRVLLDNDNIFDSNYTIGTKNISSEIIEGVQAFEDYNSNPLLKGIKTSEEVAINLTLKKGKTDISGSGEIGLGFDDKRLLKANIISVSNKLKGFSTMSHNNIGEEYSPYNFISNTLDIAKAAEFDQRTSNLIRPMNYSSLISDNRVRVNNNFFGSANGLYKFNPKLSVKTNYSFYKDELIRNESLRNDYNLQGGLLSVLTERNTRNKSLIHSFDYEFIYNINKTSLLTSTGKIETQQLSNFSKGLNNEDLFNNLTKSEDLFFRSATEFTNRINNNTVFQLLNTFSTNKIPQNINTNYTSDSFIQSIETEKQTFKLQSTLLSKIKQNEYSMSLGYNYNKNALFSNLNGLVIDNQYNSNDLDYNLAEAFLKISYRYQADKWVFYSVLNNTLLNTEIKDFNLETDFNESNFVVTPSLSFQYYLNKKSHLYFNYLLSNQLPNTENIYSGLIMLDNRSVSNNDFEFNLFYNQISTLGYRIIDLYNLFQLNLYSTYSYNKHGYVPQLNIAQDIDFYTSLTRVTDNKSLRFGFDTEKYVHSFRSTLNFKSSYSISQYQNIINDLGLRDNTSKTFSGEFHIRTGFKSSLNFENKTIFRMMKYSNSISGSNSIASLQNDFIAKYTKNNFLISFKSQYFNPKTGDNNEKGYMFLDFSLDYKPSESKFEYGFRINNLLNHSVYRDISTSDFSDSVFEHNLQQRYLLMSVKFKF